MSEAEGPPCDKCGTPMHIEGCECCDGIGGFHSAEGFTLCDWCDGGGDFWVCPNAPNHPVQP